MIFIGVGVDVQVAAYIFAYLYRTVRNLCRNYIKHHFNNSVTIRHCELMRHPTVLEL